MFALIGISFSVNSLAKLTEDPLKPKDSLAVRLHIAPSHEIRIDRINLVGNKKTRDQIILRELLVRQGQTMPKRDLDSLLAISANNIKNTRLFVDVETKSVPLTPDEVEVVVLVKERWYFYPIPIFTLADRNFNEWWTNQNRDLSRVNYGIKLLHLNFRGRKEILRVTAQFGFTRKLQLIYQIPYIDRKQKNGLSFNISFRDNKNIAYQSLDHRQIFIDSDKDLESPKQNLRESLRTAITFGHRESTYNYHFWSLQYSNTMIADTIASINPNYFLDGRSQMQYLGASYLFKRDFRDIRVYPLTGFLIEFKLSKIGLGVFDDIDQWEFKPWAAKFFDLKNGFYFSTMGKLKLSTPERQPYALNWGIGYRPDFIRGYELNVTEGQNFFYTKNVLKKRILKIKQNLDGIIPFEQFSTFPLEIYLKTHFDAGYVRNNLPDLLNDRLVNTVIYGGGVGLDFVTFYDFVVRTEYSFNSQGEAAFFLNFKHEFR